MCELTSYNAYRYPDQVEHTHCKNSKFQFYGEVWVENFIRKQSSPTESALDPPYGEIQETYLI